jgi:hypothetical protein
MATDQAALMMRHARERLRAEAAVLELQLALAEQRRQQDEFWSRQRVQNAMAAVNETGGTEI